MKTTRTIRWHQDDAGAGWLAVHQDLDDAITACIPWSDPIDDETLDALADAEALVAERAALVEACRDASEQLTLALNGAQDNAIARQNHLAAIRHGLTAALANVKGGA